MVSFEGPLISWLLGKAGPVGTWVKERLAADHLTITNVQANPTQAYFGALYAFVAVAPSKSVKPLSVMDLMDQADDFVRRFFPGDFPAEPEFAGHELVRYVAPPTPERSAENRLIFHPSGLVELHWPLATPPDVVLPLDELVDVVGRLHGAVVSGAFQRLHQPRRWERRRKVDWRVGVTPYAATSANSVSWTAAGPPELAPTRRDTGRRPSCPREGYAADLLRSVKPRTKLERLLAPVMTELLASGGYSGGVEVSASVARYLDRSLAPDKLHGGDNPIAELVTQNRGNAASVVADADAHSPAPAVNVTAAAVVAAFASKGLPVPNPRDNSHNRDSLGCRQMITTDAITVVQFDDVMTATRYADATRGDACRRGLIVLSYAAARTAQDDRPRYESVLDALLASNAPAPVVEHD